MDDRQGRSRSCVGRERPCSSEERASGDASQARALTGLLAVTWFGLPSESPTCGAGELPEQFKLPWIVLVTYSFASSSVSALSFRFTVPFTWLRMNPNQNPLYPPTVAPPLIRLSSIAFQVTPNGGPNGPEPP